MARVSSADMTEKDPQAWVEGTRSARKARANVIAQLGDLIQGADLTGSPDLVVRRIRGYAEARQSREPETERAALMELAVAAAATAAGLDIRPGR